MSGDSRTGWGYDVSRGTMRRLWLSIHNLGDLQVTGSLV
jgi:hypothetical protein